jgi:Flp pilus assembly protein TadG
MMVVSCIFRILAAIRLQRGQSLVEFAFAVPILLTVVFGVIEFGVIVSNQLTLSDVAGNAARAGAVEYGLALAAGESAPNAQSSATVSAQSAVMSGDTSTLTQCTLGSVTPSYPPGQIAVPLSCTYAPITPLGSLVNLLHGSVTTAVTLHATAEQDLEP